MRTLPTLTLAVAVSLISGCGSSTGDQVGGPFGFGTGGSPAPRSLPSELVGTWRYQLISADQVCQPGGGTCVPGITRTETLVLTPDARFQYDLNSQSNLPGCNLVGSSHGGSASASSGSLTLYVEEGFTRQDDSCGDSFNNDERGSAWQYT